MLLPLTEMKTGDGAVWEEEYEEISLGKGSFRDLLCIQVEMLRAVEYMSLESWRKVSSGFIQGGGIRI